jgi:hypothetical protein
MTKEQVVKDEKDKLVAAEQASPAAVDEKRKTARLPAPNSKPKGTPGEELALAAMY